MTRYHSRFWLYVTILLCVLFAVLFYPVVHGPYGVGLSLLFTAIGVAVIWGVYLIRAAVFSRLFQEKNDAMNNSTPG